jgi:hypothetical protein
MDIDHTPIRVMEPAIVDRLRPGFPKKTFELKRVPLTPSNREFQRYLNMLPFIGLAWAGFQSDGVNGRQTKGDMLWRLYLFVKTSSGLEARFKGDSRDIGLDAMIDVATVLLNGAVFDGIGSCHVTRAAALHAEGFADDDIAMASIDFAVKFTSNPGALKLVTPADFEAFGITWSLTGAAEDGPAVTDEIEMPQEGP